MPDDPAADPAVKIGVVSDTHMPRFGRRLPAALTRGLVGAAVEGIVHLGDFTTPEVVALLEAIAPLEAVAGNNDPAALVARFGRRKVMEIEGVRIGLVHGDEGRGSTTPARATNAFGGVEGARAVGIAAILFGHSHVPLLERRDGVLVLNPGSPTDRRRQPSFSYAVLDVHDGRVDATIARYSDRSADP